jgi:uncharacterized membrane protein YoaK (UPF0700 family)
MEGQGEAASRVSSREPEESLLGVRDALVVVLAATSGYMDAVSYLGLGRVFTSNMTGNTVLFGLALAQAQPFAALRSLLALAGFLCGVGVATLVVERAGGRKGSPLWPAHVTAAFAVEGGILLAFAVGCLVAGTPASGLVYPLIALSAVAMGMQSVAVRHLGVTGVTTTYITGTWTTLIGGLVSTALRRARSGTAGIAATALTPRARDVRKVQAAVLGVYVVAAVAGGLAESRWLLVAGVAPCVALALVVAVARRRFPGEG